MCPPVFRQKGSTDSPITGYVARTISILAHLQVLFHDLRVERSQSGSNCITYPSIIRSKIRAWAQQIGICLYRFMAAYLVCFNSVWRCPTPPPPSLHIPCLLLPNQQSENGPRRSSRVHYFNRKVAYAKGNTRNFRSSHGCVMIITFQCFCNHASACTPDYYYALILPEETTDTVIKRVCICMRE